MTTHSAINLQLHSPTGITHCASAYLTHSNTSSHLHQNLDATNSNTTILPNLIIIRSTLLEVYQPVKLSQSNQIRLELVTRQHLYGIVESLAILRGRSGLPDAILLAFRDAKLSVQQWDSASDELTTTSLHYFEGDESLKAGREAFPRPPLIVSDPHGRCAAMIMFRHQLAILPATETESSVLGVQLHEGEDVRAVAVGNSYVDNLSKVGIKEIRDAVFLFGTSEPTLLVLHEGDPTWAGNLRIKKDTCLLSALSINLSAKRSPKIWSVNNLPSDAYRLVAAPTGGALVLCTSCILYYTQGHQCGIVVHSGALPRKQPVPPLVFDLTQEEPGSAAAKYAREHATELNPQAASSVLSFCDLSCADWNIECDAAFLTWISSTTALVGLKTGQLLLIKVQKQGGGVRKLALAKVGVSPQPSCMTTLSTTNIVFIGSVVGDSLLIRCRLLDETRHQSDGLPTIASNASKDQQQEGEEEGGLGKHQPKLKRRRLESDDTDSLKDLIKKDEDMISLSPLVKKEEDEEESDEDDDAFLLYGLLEDRTPSTTTTTSAAAAAPTIQNQLQCSLSVLDSFVGSGPLRSFAWPPPHAATMTPHIDTTTASGDGYPYIVGCCGQDKSGALVVMRRSVVPDAMTHVPLPDVKGAWAVGRRRRMKNTTTDATSNKNTANTNNGDYNSHLILSFESSTKVFSAHDELKEITEEVEFVNDGPTLCAGSLGDGRYVVQIYPRGIRVIDTENSSSSSTGTDTGTDTGTASGIRCQDITTADISRNTSDSSNTIVFGNIGTAYVLVRMSNGTAFVYTCADKATKGIDTLEEKNPILVPLLATPAQERAELIGQVPTLFANGKGQQQQQQQVTITACCLYSDTSSWFSTHLSHETDATPSTDTKVPEVKEYCVVAYSDGTLAIYSLFPVLRETPVWQCTSLLRDGISLLQPTLTSTVALAAATTTTTTTKSTTTNIADTDPSSLPTSGITSSSPSLVEIKMESFGAHIESRSNLSSDNPRHTSLLLNAPIIIALTNEHTMFVYKAFAHSVDGAAVSSIVRFKRMVFDDIPPFLPPAASSYSQVTTPHAASTPSVMEEMPSYRQRIFRFDSIGEHLPHSGIFLAGTHPLWLIASRGTLYAHPSLAEGVAISSFTPFHNVNCPHGFITVCQPSLPKTSTLSATSPPVQPHRNSNYIQIASLPPRQHLDAPFPRQKIAIKATPLRIAYYPEAQLFAVAVAKQSPYSPFLPEEDGGEPQSSYAYALADAAAKARGTVPMHEVRLVQSGSWNVLWKYTVLPGENILALETVHLKDSTTGSTVPLLAVGTGFIAGEDYPCSGRVLLFEIVKSDTATKGGALGGSSLGRGEKKGRKMDGWQARVIYAREFKGPVTGVMTMEGHLLLSIGNRLETLTLASMTTTAQEEEERKAKQHQEGGVNAAAGGESAPSSSLPLTTTYKMVRSAFYDGPVLVTSLCVVKSFALIGDVQHSVQFIRYREDARQLSLLSKDFGRASVRAAQFIIAGSSLYIVSGDAAGTLRMYAYTPSDPGSWKGQKLLQWGALHVGEGIGSMARVKMPQIDGSDTAVRHGVVYGTDGGGYGAVLPIALSGSGSAPGTAGTGSDGTGDTGSSSTGIVSIEALKALQHELVIGTAHAAGLNPAAFRRRYAKTPAAMNGATPYGRMLSLPAQGIVDGDLLVTYVNLPRVAQERLAHKIGVERKDVLQALTNIMKTSRLF